MLATASGAHLLPMEINCPRAGMAGTDSLFSATLSDVDSQMLAAIMINSVAKQLLCVRFVPRCELIKYFHLPVVVMCDDEVFRALEGGKDCERGRLKLGTHV